MTTATTTAPSTHPSAWQRVWRVVRLNTTNPATVFVWPIVILAAVFAMTWLIWLIVFVTLEPENRETAGFTGAVAYIFVYMLVVAVQAVNLTFPLALGYGATRRSFSIGSSVTFALLAVFYATLLSLFGWLEAATDGWGLGAAFFRTLIFATDAGWLAQWWIYFCWFVFFFFTGMIFAAVFVRWRAVGLSTMFVLLGFLIVGAIALLTLGDAWMTLWNGIAELGTLGVATYALPAGVVSAVISHLILRRATPRS